MTLAKFIETNIETLDVFIKEECSNAPVNREGIVTKEECRLWILNNENLYHWARMEGVKI